MNSLQAKNQAKSIPIERYLDTITKKKGKKYICPFCGSGTGPKGTPGGSIDPATNKYSCFACDSMEMDIFDLVAKAESLDTATAFNRVYEMYNLQSGEPRQDPPKAEPEPPKAVPRIKEYIEKAHRQIGSYPEALSYLNGRGITGQSIDRFNLGYDPSRKQIVIPYNPSGTYYITRSINSKDFKKPKTEEAGPEPIFNPGALDGPGPVFVVEAPLCAISITQAGGQAVAIVGTGSNHFIDHIKKHGTNAQLILCLDNDESGAAAQEKLKEGLNEIGITAYAENIAGSYKDPNEALQKEPEALTARIQEVITKVDAIAEVKAGEAKAEYLKNSSAYHLKDFINGISASVNTPYTPTGFPELDKVLDGGLYEGFYIVGAISSLGKTTLVLQIADQIARAGRDVLIFSLEMARNELMAKSISRSTIELALKNNGPVGYAKTTRGITVGKYYDSYLEAERELINNAVEDYRTYAHRVFIKEGIGNIGANQIREAVAQHIEITGNTPVVIIDYLQILAPFDDKNRTDKQNTDLSVTALKRISRDFKLPLIGISSFNRDNYNAPVNMTAFKESGSIEYSSDLLIGLQLSGVGAKDFNVDEAKKKDPRRIEMKILKNRNGKTGDTITYDYYPRFNYFQEVPVTALEFDDTIQ